MSGSHAEAAPDELVDVVVAALGIADETDRFGRQTAKDLRLVPRSRIDDLAPFGARVGEVPIGDGVLALPRMGDVGVAADRIFLRDERPQLGKRDANLRTVDDAAQPGGLLLVQIRHKRVEPFLVESLRRDPHLGLRMKAVQVLRLLFEKRQQHGRVGVPGIAAGDEDGVDPRQLLEDARPTRRGLPAPSRVWNSRRSIAGYQIQTSSPY